MSEMHPNRLAAFVREFGFLSEIPHLERADKIKVARGDPALMCMHGHSTRFGGLSPSDAAGPEAQHTIFYAVSSSGVQQLKSDMVKVWGFNLENREVVYADDIGTQLHELGLRPDFIVSCGWYQGAGLLNIWTIYKMDKFDYDLLVIYSTVDDSDIEVERISHQVEAEYASDEGRMRNMDDEFSGYWE